MKIGPLISWSSEGADNCPPATRTFHSCLPLKCAHCTELMTLAEERKVFWQLDPQVARLTPLLPGREEWAWTSCPLSFQGHPHQVGDSQGGQSQNRCRAQAALMVRLAPARGVSVNNGCRCKRAIWPRHASYFWDPTWGSGSPFSLGSRGECP